MNVKNLGSGGDKVRIEEMRPRELRRAIGKHPLCYVPMGLIEWHGNHNPLGTDMTRAHYICVQAAEKSGGVVLPAQYIGGPGYSAYEGTITYRPKLVEEFLVQTMQNLEKMGFKIVIIFMSHCGPAQDQAFERAVHRFTSSSKLKVALVKYQDLFDQDRSGHGGSGETSINMAMGMDVSLEEFEPTRPDILMYEVPRRDDAWDFEYPFEWHWKEDVAKNSSLEAGKKLILKATEKLAKLARQMESDL